MPSLHYNMASILLSKEKFEEAERELKKSLSLDPAHELSLIALSNLLLKTEKYKESIDYLNRAL